MRVTATAPDVLVLSFLDGFRFALSEGGAARRKGHTTSEMQGFTIEVHAWKSGVGGSKAGRGGAAARREPVTHRADRARKRFVGDWEKSSMRQEKAIDRIAALERRGLRFRLDSDLVVIVTSSPIAPEELRQLVEKLGGDEGTPENPGTVGVLLPYVVSALKQRRDVEEVVLELRGKLAWSPEYGWGSIVEREDEGRLIFAMAKRARQLSLYANNLVLIVSEEQLKPVSVAEAEPNAEVNQRSSPMKRFLDFLK
jgi:hypothetical protein